MRTAKTQNGTRSTEPYAAPLWEMQMTAAWPVIEIQRANIDSSWGFHCFREREREREREANRRKREKYEEEKQDWTEANN